MYWFRRAVQMGDGGANLEIAKLFLATGKSHREAVRHLELVCQSGLETEADEEEAQRLLKQTRRAFQRKKSTIAS